MEISNFTSFLNHQMKLAKNSNFLSPDAAQDFPGFRTFVTRFLIQMSKDFSTRYVVYTNQCMRCISTFSLCRTLKSQFYFEWIRRGSSERVCK